MPETGLEQARTCAEELRKAIAGLKLPHADSPVSDVVTVSGGVAMSVNGDNVSASTLMRSAERALYESKDQGRNRAGCFGEDAANIFGWRAGENRMVPGAGIEPARPCGREILSLLCLPISPSGHRRGKTEGRNCIRPGWLTQFRFRNRSVIKQLPAGTLIIRAWLPGPCRYTRQFSVHWAYTDSPAPESQSRHVQSIPRCAGSGGSRQPAFAIPALPGAAIYAWCRAGLLRVPGTAGRHRA